MEPKESLPEENHLVYGDVEDETLLRELCSVNGVCYDKLAMGCGSKVLRLEIFFFGCPRIVGLHHFSNLRALCIVNQRLSRISGLETCCHLQELWMCETQIQRIDGLTHCKDLTELYLYSNQISLIEGLEGLTKLRKLWLNGNNITIIKGLDTLTELRDLNLSGNAIESVGHSLDGLAHLEVLRLSGNRLTSLQELVGLSALSQLHTLSLCDPAYSPNPVCQLCNYSTHTLYHLPHLQWLDDREVRGHHLLQIIQGLISSKKLYYRMREHQAKMACVQECKTLHQKQLSICEPTLSCIRTLTQHIKSLQLSRVAHDERVGKCEALMKRRRDLMDYVGLVECCKRDACELARQWTEQQCRKSCIELESGGNIKFTTGEPSLSWYKSCSDLINSRFSVDNTRNVGVSITGIQVKSVTRVENRMLYNRFNDKIRLLVDEDASNATNSNGKNPFDYLFLVWQSGQCYVDVCKDGLCGDGPISLSNSVNMADAPRLEDITSRQDHLLPMKLAALLNGQLLLCKVYTSQGLELKEGDKHYHSDAESAGRQWFISDSDLVLPEYIIQFSYISQLSSKDVLDIMLLKQPPVGEGEDLALPIPTQPRLAMLDTATVLQLTSQPNLSSVKELILHDHHLSRFRLSSGLAHLVKLVLSFNELTVTEDFKDMPNLEILDLGFNKLTCLHGMKNLPNLLQLDVSWNKLESYHHDIAVLRRHTPALSSLDARNNPWNKASGFRMHALGRLRSLSCLDDHQVTKEESSAAAKQMSLSHLSLTNLMGVACTISAPPPCLSLLPIAEYIHCSAETVSIPYPRTVSANDWPTMVTSVALCNNGVSKLSCLDQFPNLRWLSLSDNALTSLEGLAPCSKLEELSVDRNLLESAFGVEGLFHLKWLSLSSNRLTELPSLRNLTQLSYFNFSDNSISLLTNLKSIPSLVELYASSNVISDLRQLFCLKPLLHLVVVDFSYNPIASTSTYRSFALYHLSFIRALDAQPVEASELASAREKFGGRLTQDLISERYPDIQLSSLRSLDLLQSGLKTVDLSPVEAFDNLASLNLEHNSLSSFSGLIYLNKLKVLCLNHNRIECLQQSCRDPLPLSNRVLNSLEVLHLAYNGIVNLAALQLGRISSLRALFLQGNEIVYVDGLEGLECLTELVLDRNKIKDLRESSFASLINLRELHLEENRLKELSHLSTSLPHLERLYLGMNRIQEFCELEKLSGLAQLMELSIVSNPVSRRLQHRSLLIFHLPSLLSLDGVMVTADERHVAQMTFGSLHEPYDMDDIGDVGSGMPTLGQATPLKVLTVPFAQFGHSYNSQHKHNATGMRGEPAYFQQLRKGRRTNN